MPIPMWLNKLVVLHENALVIWNCYISLHKGHLSITTFTWIEQLRQLHIINLDKFLLSLVFYLQKHFPCEVKHMWKLGLDYLLIQTSGNYTSVEAFIIAWWLVTYTLTRCHLTQNMSVSLPYLIIAMYRSFSRLPIIEECIISHKTANFGESTLPDLFRSRCISSRWMREDKVKVTVVKMVVKMTLQNPSLNV